MFSTFVKRLVLYSNTLSRYSQRKYAGENGNVQHDVRAGITVEPSETVPRTYGVQ